MERPDFTQPGSFRYKMRRKRLQIFEAMARKKLETQSELKILDVGGTAEYWQLLSPDLLPKLHFTLINLASWPGMADGGPEGLQFEARIGDACSMPEFTDGQFDICHSNSVIEHVGNLQAMARFAAETTRVSKSFYHQTPNLCFPIEPHYGVPFLHWLPSATRARILNNRKVGYGEVTTTFEDTIAVVDHTELLSAWLFKKLFPQAKFQREKFLVLFTKSLIVTGGEDA